MTRIPNRQSTGRDSPIESILILPLSMFANSTFFLIIVLLAMPIVIGVSGYMLIEGWPFLDALFMTMITISTIGYGETKPLSDGGRLFTIFLIILGVGTASYAITRTIELAVSQDILTLFRQRGRQRRLEQLEKHTIICGFGRVGSSVARALQEEGAPCVVIDTDPDVIERCQELGFPTVMGNGADEHTLDEAGIGRAEALVSAAKSDADNVFIVLTARSINPKLKIISRCNMDSSIAKLEKAGADSVISPYSITGHRIAQMLTRPNVVNFLDGILQFGDHQMRIEEFIITEKSPLAGLTLLEAKLKVAVLAVDHPGEMVSTHPNANTKLLPGTAIIAMGIPEELDKLEEIV